MSRERASSWTRCAVPESGEAALDLRAGNRDVGRLFLESEPDPELRAGSRPRSPRCRGRDRPRATRPAGSRGRDPSAQRRDQAGCLRAVATTSLPLTAIRAATDGLESSDLELSDKDRAGLLSRSTRETRRLDRLVSNLLDLSRLELGAAEPKPELWTVETLVGQALGELGARAERVAVTLPANLDPIEVDGAQIEHVLVNLIDNALTFSPDAPVELTGEQLNGEVVVRVVDHGPGLDEGGWSGSSSRSSRAACRAGAPDWVSRSHRGSRRPTGRGSRLNPGARAARARALTPVKRVSTHILVVDDEPEILRALETTLRGAGYEIETAATGEDALVRAGIRTPDGVILDLVLPGKSGVEVCRELRKTKRRRDRRAVGRR